MKKFLLLLIISFLFSSNSYAGYKIKLQEQNKYGSVFTISLPLIIDNLSKWNRAFDKTINLANNHCKSLNKKTFAFWSEQLGHYSRNSNGKLLENYNTKKNFGFTQDMEGGYFDY